MIDPLVQAAAHLLELEKCDPASLCFTIFTAIGGDWLTLAIGG